MNTSIDDIFRNATIIFYPYKGPEYTRLQHNDCPDGIRIYKHLKKEEYKVYVSDNDSYLLLKNIIESEPIYEHIPMESGCLIC